MEQFGAGAVMAIFVFGVVLTIAWIILPFALIGTKPLLRELSAQQKRTNALLAERNAAAPAAPIDTTHFTFMCDKCHSFIRSDVAACPNCGAENPHRIKS
jgi:hypothetical protein